MAKKDSKSGETPEEIPAEKPTIEDVVAEAHMAQDDAEKEAEAQRLKEEEEAKIPEVEVDLDAEREKTRKEVTESVTKDVVEPLKEEIAGLKKAMAPEDRDPYEKFVEEYTEKHGTTPEWKVLSKYIEENAVNKIKEEQAARAKEEKDAQDTAKQQEETQATENFKVWQGQLEEIESKGLIPKMEKPEAGDAGFDARVKLYGFMQGTWKTPTPSTNLWEVHAKFGEQLKTGGQPAGGDAPVSLGNTGGSPGDDKDSVYGPKDREMVQREGLEGFILAEMKRQGRA